LRDLLENVLIGRRLKANDPNHHRKYAGSHNNDSAHDHTNGHQQSSRPQGSLYNSRDSSSGYVCHNEMHINTPGLARMLSVAQSSGIGDSHHQHRHQHHHHHHHHHHRDSSKSSYLDGSLSTIQMAGFLLLDPVSMGLHLDAALTVPSKPTRSRRRLMRRLQVAGSIRIAVLLGRSWRQFPSPLVAAGLLGTSSSVVSSYGGQQPFALSALIQHNKSQLEDIRQVVIHLKGVAEALLVARCKDGLLRNMEQLAGHVATLEAERKDAVDMRNKIENWLVQVETGQNVSSSSLERDGVEDQTSKRHANTHADGGVTSMTSSEPGLEGQSHSPLLKFQSSERIRSRLASGLSGFCAQICGHKRMYLEAHISIRPTWTTHHHSHSEDGTHDTSHSTGHHSGRRHHHHHPAQEHDLENISDANTSRHVVLVLAADGKWIREASPVTTIHMDENTIGDGSASASEHHHQGTFTTAVDPQTIDWHRICLWSSHSSGHPAQAVLNMVEELEKQIEAELQFSTTAGNSGANNNSNINPTLLDINTTLILTCEPFEGVAPEVKSAGVTAACTGHVARCLATWLAVHHRTVCRSNSDHHHHHRHHHHHHGHNNNDYNRSKGSTRLLGQLVGDSLGAGLPAITALIGRHVVGSDLQADYEESHVESDFQGSVEASGAMEGQAVASPAEVSLASEMNTGKNIIVRKLSTRHVVHLLQFCYESTHGTPTSTSVHGSHRINQHQQHYSHRHSGIKQAELVGFQDVLSLFSLDNHNSNHSHRHHQFQHSSANGGDPSATHDTHSKGQTPQLFPHKLVLLAAPSGGVDVALLRGTAVIPYLAACAGINLGQNTNIAMSKGRGSRQPRSQIADNFISANLGDIEPTGLYIVLTMPYERQTAVFGDTLTGTGGHSNNHGHSNDHHTHDHYLKNGRSIRHRNGGTWLVVFILRVEDPTETRRNSSRTTTTQASGATSSDVRPNHHHHHHHHDHGHLTQLGSSKPITFGWPSLVSLTALRTVFLSVQSLLSLEGAMGRPIFSHFFLRSAMELLVTGSGHSHDHDVQDSSKSQRMGDVNDDRDRITLGASVSVRNKDQSRRAALRARRRSGLKSTQVHEVTVQGMLKNLLALTSAKLGRMLVHSIDTGTSSYDYMDGDNENDDSSVSSGSSSGVDAANVSLPRHAHCFLLHDLSVASGHVLPSKRIYGHIKMFSGLANADEGDSDGEGEDDDCILAGSHQILCSIGDAQIDLTEYGTGEAEAPNGSVTTALWSLDTLYGDSLYNGAADTSSATPSATPSSVGEGGGVGVGQDRVLKGSLPTALMDADIIVRLKFYLPSSVSHILNQAYKVSKLMPHSEQSYHHSHGHQGRSQERQVLAVVLFPLYGGGIESSLNTEGLLRTTPALLDLLGISAKVSGLMLKTFAPFWSHPHAIKLAHKTICDTTQALSAASGDIDGSNNSATGNDFIVSAAVGSKPYRYHTDTETETDDAFAGVGSQADWSSLIQDIQSLEQEANHSAIIRRALKDSQRRCDILSRTIVSISGAICPEDVAKEIWFDILESNRNMSIGTNTAPNDATDLKNSHGNWQLQLADVNLGSCEVSAVDNLCTCLSVIADYQGRLQQDFLCMLLRYGGLVALEEATNVLTAAAKTIGEELHAPLPSPVVWWSHDIATRPDHEVNSSPARGSGRNSNNNGNNGRSNSYTIPIKSREHLAIRGMYSVDMLESAIRTGQRVQFTDTVGGTSGVSILKPRIASKAETTAAAAAAAVNGNISSNVDNANISTMDFFSSLLHDNAKGRDDSGGRVTSSNQDLRIGLGVTHTLGSKTETVVYSPLLYPSNPKNESSSRVSHSNRANILNNSHHQRANLVQAVVQYRQVESRGSKHNANINHHDGNLGTSISDSDHNNSNSNSNEPIWMPPTSSNVGERGSTLAVRIFESSLLSLSESLRSVSAGIDRPLIQMPPASTAVTSASTNGKNSLKDRDVMSGRNDYNSSNIIDGGIIPILPRDVALQKIYTPYGGLLSESLSALSQVIREIVCEGGKDASDGPISNALHTALRRRLAMAAGSVLAAMIGSQARVAVLFFDSHSHTHTHTDDQGRLKQEKVVPLGGDDLHLHGHNHRYPDESLSGDLYSLDLFDDAATGDHIGSYVSINTFANKSLFIAAIFFG
ncbi:MAG: hypothetical protein CMA81_00280, partial [Euryarchaeota archaeon]|nr:hypothetical protein [Euryarchaeota archaeon]